MPFDPSQPATLISGPVPDEAEDRPFDPSQPATLISDAADTSTVSSGAQEFDESKPHTLVAGAEEGKSWDQPFVHVTPELVSALSSTAGLFKAVFPESGQDATEGLGKDLQEAGRGAQEEIADTLTGLSKPSSLALTGATIAAPVVMGPVMAALGARQMGKAAGEATVAWNQGDYKEAARLGIRSLLSAAQVAGGLYGGFRSRGAGEPGEYQPTYEPAEGAPPISSPNRLLPAPRLRMPEFQDDTLGIDRNQKALPAPGEGAGTILLPESPLGPRTAGYRIKVPPFEERPPIDVEAEPVPPETVSNLQQVVKLSQEAEPTGAEPFKPPTVSTDLRQLQAIMRKNSVSSLESWADGVIKEKLGGTSANPFLDPHFLSAAVVKGAAYMARGASDFSDWSEPMLSTFGKEFAPNLHWIYDAAKQVQPSQKDQQDVFDKPLVNVSPGMVHALSGNAHLFKALFPEAGQGAEEEFANLATSFTTPRSALIGAAAAVAPNVVMPVLGIEGLMQLKGTIGPALDAFQKGDYKEAARLSVRSLASGAQGLAGALHGPALVRGTADQLGIGAPPEPPAAEAIGGALNRMAIPTQNPRGYDRRALEALAPGAGLDAAAGAMRSTDQSFTRQPDQPVPALPLDDPFLEQVQREYPQGGLPPRPPYQSFRRPAPREVAPEPVPVRARPPIIGPNGQPKVFGMDAAGGRDETGAAGEEVHGSDLSTPEAAEDFIADKVLPEQEKQVRSWFDSIRIPVQKLLAPHAIDDTAEMVANSVRDYNSERALSVAQADHAFAWWRRSFDKTPVRRGWRYQPGQPLPRNFAFMDSSEKGGASLGPAELKLKSMIDEMFARDVSDVQQLSPNALRDVMDDYFPHMWKDPAAAKAVFAEIHARSPLEGSKAFMKKRTLEYFRDGLERGLEPVSDNPIDLVLFKHAEIRKYIMAKKVLAEAKQIGARKFVYAFEKPPEGWVQVNDPTSVVNAPPHVEVKEAFDAQMRTKTVELLRRLGVPHERVAKMRGSRWGEASTAGDIRTRFAGPDSVIWHELGHQLEFRYKMSDQLASTPELKNELQTLANARLVNEPNPSPGRRAYVQSLDEKMATVLEAYLHAPELMQQRAPQVYAKFREFIGQHPELRAIDEIKPSLAIGTAKMKIPVNGRVTLGHYYMPEGAAAVLSNYLSPGLSRFGLYRTIRGASNIMNSAQLGFSAFHLGFTSIDAAVSHAATGLHWIATGRPLKGLGRIMTTPAAPWTTYYRGKRLQAEMLKPGSYPRSNQIADLAVKGGLRATSDPLWRSEWTRKFQRALGEGNLRGYANGLTALPFAAVEQVMRPITEYIVPRQKLGVFAQMAQDAMERLGPDADVHAVRKAMAQAADSTENRMGQMTYDNLFHHTVVKDLALIGFRSYGWQLGKYREAIGAGADYAKVVRDLATGKKPEVTPRMAYVAALPMVLGAMGGIFNTLATGTLPQGLMDLYFPRTGRMDRNGKPQRVSLPSYLKDLVSDWHDFPDLAKMGPSFYHKLNPMISVVADMLRNRDFYDVKIRGEDDPVLLPYLKFGAQSLRPFSIQGGLKLAEDPKATAADWVLPFFGVVPAKRALTMTAAEAKAADLMMDQLPQGSRTREQYDRSEMAKQILQTMKEEPEEGKAQLRSAMQAGQITARKGSEMMNRLNMTPLQFQMSRLPAESGMQVWDLMNAQEKYQVRDQMKMRVLRSETLSVEKKKRFLDVISKEAP